MKKHNQEQKSLKKSRFAPRQMFFLIAFFMMSILTYAQNKTVTGTITDNTGEPIIGATILVKGTKTGTISDLDGRFSIETTAGSKLNISYVGYVSEEITIGNKTSLDIVLREASTELDAVVVVGYGTQKKATLTGAVSAVSSKEMTVTKNESVVNMLTGKLPGVRITQMSSRPGAFETDIDIRGMDGTPLIIIDGVPRDKDYLGRMDANEIESISVLKDASAAVYGLRSSNGVILVTTKRGDFSKGQFNVSYSFNQGWQQFLYVPDNVGALEYMALSNEKQWRGFDNNYMNKRPPVFTQGDMDPFINGTRQTTNWMDATFKKTAPQSQHNFTVDGGTEKVSYFFNLGYMKQDGALRTGDMNYDRWNFRSNVDLKITNNLKAMVSIGGYLDEMNEPRTDIWAVYKNAWIERPDAEIYANGNPDYLNGVNLIGDHPLAVTNSDITGYRKRLTKVFNGQLALIYDLPWVKGLSAKASYSYDFKYADNTDYKKFYSLYEYDSEADKYKVKTSKNAPSSSVQRESFPDYKTLMQLSANYKRSFSGIHNVGALVLFEEEYSSWDSFYGFSELKLNSEYLSAGSGSQRASMHGIGERTGQGLVGKFNYDYSGKYLAEFSFRYDGSSKFPKGSRWGFFPAASIGWRVSEESFIKGNTDLNFIDNIKFRASYGKTGDDGAANNYPPTLGFSIDQKQSWIYGEELQPGLVPMPLLNPDFTWYTSKTLDLGIDWNAWNGLFGGSFDYFQRDRKNLPALRDVLIPGTVGASLPQENLNSDRTSGLELVLTHRYKIGDVSYNVGFQMSSTREQWRTKVDSKAGNSYDNWRNRYGNRYKDIWWGKEYGGQFQNYDQIYNHPANVGPGNVVPGDYYYVDWNGDGVIDGKDEYPIATFGKPRFNYGINLGAEWKGIDLSMNFQGASDVYVQYGEMLSEPLSFGGGGTMTKFWDRWHLVDSSADMFDPSSEWISGYYPVTGSPVAEGTRAIQDASYLRLKTLEIGYTLPRKLISRVGLRDLRVYFSGYNLLTFTSLKDMDPERPGGAGQNESDRNRGGWTIDNYKYPINKTFNIGLSLKF